MAAMLAVAIPPGLRQSRSGTQNHRSHRYVEPFPHSFAQHLCVPGQFAFMEYKPNLHSWASWRGSQLPELGFF
jgi:hypothetical protein